MTNVNAGDLAIVKSPDPLLQGRIVEVIYPAPGHDFEFPDGGLACGAIVHPSWVLKFIGGPIRARTRGGGMRDTWYAVGSDRGLRRLPGDPEPIEYERIPVTSTEKP